MKLLSHLRRSQPQRPAALRIQKPVNAIVRPYVVCDQPDILDAIWHIQTRQHSSCFVSIRHVASALGLTDEDRLWFLGTLKRMDEAGRILLSALEKPQDLASYSRDWFVKNATGLPCHEVCVNTDPTPPPLLRVEHGTAATLAELTLWPAAPDESTHNPHMQQRRVQDLVKEAAETLQTWGRACA